MECFISRRYVVVFFLPTIPVRLVVPGKGAQITLHQQKENQDYN